jgi:hypothetical protein
MRSYIKFVKKIICYDKTNWPSTFFVTFTFVKRLWDPFIKALHTLHTTKLNLPSKIEIL